MASDGSALWVHYLNTTEPTTRGGFVRLLAQVGANSQFAIDVLLEHLG